MTREEKVNDIRRRLRAAGLTITEVARELEVDSQIVFAVLSGRLKGDRGDARRVADRFGLRDERPVSERLDEALRVGGAK
ncbi:hypothetical protein [Phyllobacterium leguminum]|nr:hypothetical protein [Phyllobacterium leguminum]